MASEMTVADQLPEGWMINIEIQKGEEYKVDLYFGKALFPSHKWEGEKITDGLTEAIQFAKDHDNG